MEWVHPGTIHKYAKTDQNADKKNLESAPPATTVANAGAGLSSSLVAGPLDGDEG